MKKTTRFWIIPIVPRDTTFLALCEVGKFIESYYVMSKYSYGFGYVDITFDGNVSDVVLNTINRLISRFGCTLTLVSDI